MKIGVEEAEGVSIMAVNEHKVQLNGLNLAISKMAHAGFEPATFALLARRSNQLS
jgi:hypothetical protein